MFAAACRLMMAPDEDEDADCGLGNMGCGMRLKPQFSATEMSERSAALNL